MQQEVDWAEYEASSLLYIREAYYIARITNRYIRLLDEIKTIQSFCTRKKNIMIPFSNAVPLRHGTESFNTSVT